MLDRSWIASLAVGTLFLLGVFLFLDARANVFITLESAGGTTAWGIVGAIPALVTSYVVGVLLIAVAGVVFRCIRGLHSEQDALDLAFMAGVRIKALQAYNSLTEQARFFEGASLGFAALAVGGFSEAHSYDMHRTAGLLIGWGCLSLAALSPLMAARFMDRARLLARTCRCDVCHERDPDTGTL